MLWSAGVGIDQNSSAAEGVAGVNSKPRSSIEGAA